MFTMRYVRYGKAQSYLRPRNSTDDDNDDDAVCGLRCGDLLRRSLGLPSQLPDPEPQADVKGACL